LLALQVLVQVQVQAVAQVLASASAPASVRRWWECSQVRRARLPRGPATP
jgi:hypothetical protein